MAEPMQKMVGAVDRLKFVPDVSNIVVGSSIGGTVGGAGGVQNGVGAGVGAGAAVGGGGFQFTPEGVDAVIAKWEDLLEQLRADERDVRILADVRPPGNEFASGDFADAGRASGDTLMDQNMRMIDYVQRYIEALQKAKDSIQVKEDDTVQALNQAASDV